LPACVKVEMAKRRLSEMPRTEVSAHRAPLRASVSVAAPATRFSVVLARMRSCALL
jgi:hypothetical protein